MIYVAYSAFLAICYICMCWCGSHQWGWRQRKTIWGRERGDRNNQGKDGEKEGAIRETMDRIKPQGKWNRGEKERKKSRMIKWQREVFLSCSVSLFHLFLLLLSLPPPSFSESSYSDGMYSLDSLISAAAATADFGEIASHVQPVSWSVQPWTRCIPPWEATAPFSLTKHDS